MEQKGRIKMETADHKCSFCNPSTLQVQTILRVTLSQLRKMLKVKRYADMSQGSQQNNGAISRLVRVIFEQNQFELKMSKGCPHSQLRHIFKEKLRCRNDQLEVILEDLCDRFARRNYELEIIASQIKNVQTSVIDYEEIEEPPRGIMKMTENEPIFRQQSKGEEAAERIKERGEQRGGQAEVKMEEIEELVQPVPKAAEGSPSTGMPYMSTTFGEMPYSYNFLFYGNYYH